MKISGLILSAGFSGRMNSFKPILKFNDKPLIVLITEKLLKVCDDVIIVTGHNSEIIEETVTKTDRIKITFNENYQKGMFTSLKRGLIEASDSDWVIYHFVDQPALPEIFYNEFVEQISEKYNWIQPVYNSVKGHPLLLNRSLFEIITNEDDDSSLKVVSRNSKVKKKIWDCKYPQVLNDLDTREDFEKLNSHEGSLK